MDEGKISEEETIEYIYLKNGKWIREDVPFNKLFNFYKKLGDKK